MDKTDIGDDVEDKQDIADVEPLDILLKLDNKVLLDHPVVRLFIRQNYCNKIWFAP